MSSQSLSGMWLLLLATSTSTLEGGVELALYYGDILYWHVRPNLTFASYYLCDLEQAVWLLL